jgi:hypothetical protein
MDVFELTVDYGAEELSALGRLLGAGEAPGLNAPDPAPMSPETRRAVHAAAWRGLVARRALVIEPGPPPSFAVTEPHASLLAPLIAPERALTIDRWTPTAPTRWTVYLREGAAVEQEALPGLLYRHTLLPREAAADRVLRAAAIPDREPGAGDPVETTRAALTEERKDDTPPVLYAAKSVVQVRAGERALVWVDAGRLGLWCGTGPGSAPEAPPRATVRLEPAGADALRAALRELSLR